MWLYFYSFLIILSPCLQPSWSLSQTVLSFKSPDLPSSSPLDILRLSFFCHHLIAPPIHTIFPTSHCIAVTRTWVSPPMYPPTPLSLISVSYIYQSTSFVSLSVCQTCYVGLLFHATTFKPVACFLEPCHLVLPAYLWSCQLWIWYLWMHHWSAPGLPPLSAFGSYSCCPAHTSHDSTNWLRMDSAGGHQSCLPCSWHEFGNLVFLVMSLESLMVYWKWEPEFVQSVAFYRWKFPGSSVPTMDSLHSLKPQQLSLLMSSLNSQTPIQPSPQTTCLISRQQPLWTHSQTS